MCTRVPEYTWIVSEITYSSGLRHSLWKHAQARNACVHSNKMNWTFGSSMFASEPGPLVWNHPKCFQKTLVRLHVSLFYRWKLTPVETPHMTHVKFALNVFGVSAHPADGSGCGEATRGSVVGGGRVGDSRWGWVLRKGGLWPLPCLLVVLGWGQGAGRLGQAEARGTAVLMVGGVAVRR